MNGRVPVPGCAVQLPWWGGPGARVGCTGCPLLPRVGGAVLNWGAGPGPARPGGCPALPEALPGGVPELPGVGRGPGVPSGSGGPAEAGGRPPRIPPPHAGSGVPWGGASPAAAPRGLGRTSQ